MRTLFSSIFDIKPNPSETTSTCFKRIEELIISWLESEYSNKWNLQLNLSYDNKKILPLSAHTIKCSYDSAGNCELATADWCYPDQTDGDMKWHAVCTLAKYDNDIQIAIILKLISLKTIIQPTTIINFNNLRPEIVDDLLATTKCFIEDQPIPTSLLNITAKDVPDFINKTLFSTTRRLPIILISCGKDGKYLADTIELQKALLGLAQIVKFKDRLTAETFSIHAPNIPCFNGAVRLCWPNLSANSKPSEHPLYVPSSIILHEKNEQSLAMHLFRLLVDVSAFRFSDTSVIHKTNKAIDESKQKELKKFLKASKINDPEKEELYRTLEKSQEENLKLFNERNEAYEQVSRLSSELESLKAEMKNGKKM